jgi:hypothetical protein
MRIAQDLDGHYRVLFETKEIGIVGDTTTVCFDSLSHIENTARAMLTAVEKMKPIDPLESEEFVRTFQHGRPAIALRQLTAWIRAHAAEIAEFERNRNK